MPRGLSLKRYFVFSFCLPRCLARPLIIVTDYRVPRVVVVCQHCEKGEGRKTPISCVQGKRRSVCRRIWKKEGEGTRVEEYGIKEAREDAALRRTERKSLYVVSWPCIRAVRLFVFLFLALLSFIRARSVARTRNQPVFSASVCLPQSISGS